VDISPTGIQLWCDQIEDLEAHTGNEEVVEFEVRFKARQVWSQPMEDNRSYLTGWEIEKEG